MEVRDEPEVAHEEVFGENRKPGFEVAHTNRVVLVNRDGEPVETFLAVEPAEMAKLRRILEGKSPFPKPGGLPANPDPDPDS